MVNLIIKGAERFFKINAKQKATKLLEIFAVLFLTLLLINKLHDLTQFINVLRMPQNGAFVYELGGYTNYGDSLLVAKDFLGDETIFSTYASALEAMTDKFQPSGTDYIIHVLGDKQREQYLKNFMDGNYKYAQTIRHDYNKWEGWVSAANWFFYRHLYKDYQPVMLTDYSVIWEKSPKPAIIYSNEMDIKIIKDSNSVTRLQVILDKNINAIADVTINYETQLKFGLDYRMYVNAYDKNAPDSPLVGFGLPEGKTKKYIPIVVENGVGEIVLTALPEKNASIEVTGATINNLLMIPNVSQAQ